MSTSTYLKIKPLPADELLLCMRNRLPVDKTELNISLAAVPLVLPQLVMQTVLLQLTKPSAIVSVHVQAADIPGKITTVTDVWTYQCELEESIEQLFATLLDDSDPEPMHRITMQVWLTQELAALRQIDFVNLYSQYMHHNEFPEEVDAINELINNVAKKLYPRTKSAIEAAKGSKGMLEDLMNRIKEHVSTCDCPSCTAHREDHPKQ